MNWLLSLYVAALFLVSLLLGIVSYAALRQRNKPGGLPLSLLMLAVAEWSFTVALELIADTIPAKVFWSKIEYLGITTSPVFLFWFAWDYARQEGRLAVRYLFLLLVAPLLILTLAATNEGHHLIWTSFTPAPPPYGQVLVYGHGLGFWVMVAYSYASISIATFLLVKAALRFRHIHRLQFAILSASMASPWIANVIYVFDLSPVPGLDLTPVTFALSGLLLAWSFYRLYLFDLIPVARDRVIEDMWDGVLVLDGNGRVVDVNAAAQHLIGTSARLLIGQPASEVLAQRFGVTGKCWDGAGVQDEVLVDGGRCFECRTSPVQLREGRLSGHLIVLRDITDRRRAEEALRELNTTLEAQVAARTEEIRAEKERGDAILRSVSDGILVTGPDMRVRYANPAFTRLTGYALQDVLGNRVHSTLVGMPPERFRQSVGLALAEGSSWRSEVTVRRHDGRTFDAALAAAPMHDAEGHLEGYVFTLQDISQRKDLERARSRFLDNVSHQFRTPVTTLQLCAHLLREVDLPEEARSHLQAMDRQIAWLSGLVQDVMEITALDSGKAAIAWEPLSLSALIDGVMQCYQERAEAAGLVLSCAPAPPVLPPVRGDQGRLSQALGEIVENALTFTLPGGSVTLEAAIAESEGRMWVTIAVRDSGPGIPSDEQDRVFERFFRGGRVEAGQIPGTGLGLSIVQEIARAHGGQVTVASGIKGSTFTLWLPIAE
jgi:PAS domain S-box-containing protein